MKLINRNLWGVKMVYNDLENMLNEYNWDNGFEIPKEILADPRCDLALALEIFYLSDGYAYLEDLERTTDLKEWNSFITALYDDISNNKFPKTGKSFKIPLSKVQKYKLQKKGISKIFLSFFKNTLRNTLCPILKIEEPEKCVRQRLHRK